MLEELGAPYRLERLEYGPSMKAPAYLAIHPMGKVPAIRHGAVVVTEAAAICAYLADAFPAAGKRFIAGDSFSAADVYIGSQIGWGMRFGTLPKRPEFEAYWDGLKDRPAHRRVESHVEAMMAEQAPASQASG